MIIMIIIIIIIMNIISKFGARFGVVVKALRYKPGSIPDGVIGIFQ